MGTGDIGNAKRQDSQCPDCSDSPSGYCLLHQIDAETKISSRQLRSDYIPKTSAMALYEALEAILRSNGATMRPLPKNYSSNVASCNFCDEKFTSHDPMCVWFKAQAVALSFKDRLN